MWFVWCVDVYVCVSVLYVCVSVHTRTHTRLGIFGGGKKELDLLELELRMIVCGHWDMN